MMDKMCGTPENKLKNTSCYNASCDRFAISEPSVITIMKDKMGGISDDMLKKNNSCYNALCNNFDIVSR